MSMWASEVKVELFSANSFNVAKPLAGQHVESFSSMGAETFSQMAKSRTILLYQKHWQNGADNSHRE